ncbi:nucleotidyltransferase [Bacillus massiliglaciei]|uniref:nucleotidyltransferase n=1 Tax=Bacillus massiliglaciei TaxID=1816693 RepID=UPI000A5D6FFE
MKAVGLVVEYNPFHNGHAYHAAESKKQAEADLVVAVMSGPFLQRGEPALVSKWARTSMALAGGIDLVVELPYAFSTQMADAFARGAVSILEALGCESLCFGSENGQIDTFLQSIQLMEDKAEEYETFLREFMKNGNSYPKAASLAFREITKEKSILDLSKPNNILGKEYVRTILENGYSVKPRTIRRISADYHDTLLGSNPIASATGIRKSIIEDQHHISSISDYVPASSLSFLESYLNTYGSFHHWELYWPLLKYRIVTATVQELAQIYEVEEGIEHRIKEMGKEASSFQEYMTKMKTKRYTWTRLQRMSTHLLTWTTKEEMREISAFPSYIRLLGMTERGRNFLHNQKKKLPLPVISRLSAYNGKEISADTRASSVYALGLAEPYQTLLSKREYKSPLIL